MTKAIFPVGGLGTRFLPATKAIPKEMLPVLNKPLIQYAVEEALASGIQELIFVTGKGKTAIEDHFDRDFELENLLGKRPGSEASLAALQELALPPGKVVYVRQQQPLGLGHAVWCARELIGDAPFAVILADDLIYGGEPCLSQLIRHAHAHGGSWAAVMDVPPDHTSRYGILDIEHPPDQTFSHEVVKARGLVEKPLPDQAPSCTAIVGRYVLGAQVMSLLDDAVRAFDPTQGSEIQLTDALGKLSQTHPVYGLHFQGKRFDCGTLPGMFEATLAMAQHHPHLHAMCTTLKGHSL